MSKHKIKQSSGIKWRGTVNIKLHQPWCRLNCSGGEGVCDCDGEEQRDCQNLVLVAGLQSIVDHLISIDGSDTANGFISHIEIGMGNTPAAGSDTALVKPKARKAINSASRSTTNAVFSAFFSGVEATSNSSLVASATSNTSFSVTAGQGSLFEIGQMIQVDDDFTVITNISTDTLTVSPALPAQPTIGFTVKQAYCELGLFGGSSATTTIGTGIAFARTLNFTPFVKNATYGATIEWVIEFT